MYRENRTTPRWPRFLASALLIAACASDDSSEVGDGGCPTACSQGFICCNATCVNPQNDVLNCGGCGRKCDGPAPFCDGTCGTAPCSGVACSDPTLCCGDQCCNSGQLCCRIAGPVLTRLTCSDPVEGTCPVGCPKCECASPDTPIATPEGSRPIASLRRGDSVYSVDRGRVVVALVREIRRVPARHHVVTRLVMESGVVLEISGVHPTADGRTIAALRVGDELDGLRVAGASIVPFVHDATYDILPDSDTGTYFAAGVLIGSTLAAKVAVDASKATTPACE